MIEFDWDGALMVLAVSLAVGGVLVSMAAGIAESESRPWKRTLTFGLVTALVGGVLMGGLV